MANGSVACRCVCACACLCVSVYDNGKTARDTMRCGDSLYPRIRRDAHSTFFLRRNVSRRTFRMGEYAECTVYGVWTESNDWNKNEVNVEMTTTSNGSIHPNERKRGISWMCACGCANAMRFSCDIRTRHICVHVARVTTDFIHLIGLMRRELRMKS